MFTGIIEEVGTIGSLVPLDGGVRIGIAAPQSVAELRINDSIAVNGVCLTVVAKNAKQFEAVAVEETLKKTTLGRLKTGSRVNLEPPLRFNDRLGGHLVLGHVDTVGAIVERSERGTSWMFGISIPENFRQYTVPVGSIGVDGVSLTIAEAELDRIRVSIIPHTMEKTIFSAYAVGDEVNLEFDIVGKYIERMVFTRTGGGMIPGGPLTIDQLKEQGF